MLAIKSTWVHKKSRQCVWDCSYVHVQKHTSVILLFNHTHQDYSGGSRVHLVSGIKTAFYLSPIPNVNLRTQKSKTSKMCNKQRKLKKTTTGNWEKNATLTTIMYEQTTIN